MTLKTEELNLSDPAKALQLAQHAPTLLSKPPPANDFFPLSMLKVAESPESWTDIQSLFLACLRTGDDKSAFLSLERLIQRFGTTDERVMALKGLYQEAVARDDSDLEEILEEYQKILEENPMNTPIIKRRIALLRSIQLPHEAITALVDFLETSPTDGEAWCEISDLYQSQGMSSQAIFSMEEALLLAPNAWNLHARLGELEYMAAMSNSEGADSSLSLLFDSVRRFCRSIELCDDYLRGYYGLKLTTETLLQKSTLSKNNLAAAIPEETVRRLKVLATEKLRASVKAWEDGATPEANHAETIAAKALLEKFGS